MAETSLAIKSPPALAVSGLRASYGEQAVLRDLQMRIDAGEIVGLAGINGAGKTTLLKCLASIRRTQGGEITLFGESHTKTGSQRVFYLPERFTPAPELTGAGYLRAMLGLLGARPGATDITETAVALGLPEQALARRIASYSKGMVQKIGLALALLSERPLLLLDEPMTGLDPLARAGLRQALQATHRRRGCAMLLCSHLLTDLQALCHRILALHGGQIAFAGSLAQWRERFATNDLEQAFLRCIGFDPVKPAPASTSHPHPTPAPASHHHER